MDVAVGLVIALMVIFAIVSAIREVNLYRQALKGEIEFLVSRRRRNRRLFISMLLLMEAALLHVGFFVLSPALSLATLLFWLLPLVLIFLIIYLTLQDFKETSRDIDRIFQEAYRAALDKAKRDKSKK